MPVLIASRCPDTTSSRSARKCNMDCPPNSNCSILEICDLDVDNQTDKPQIHDKLEAMISAEEVETEFDSLGIVLYVTAGLALVALIIILIVYLKMLRSRRSTAKTTHVEHTG